MSDRPWTFRVDEDDLRNLKETAKSLGMEFPDFMRAVVEEGAQEAKNIAPGSGPLKDSIIGGVEGSGVELQAYVKSDLFYAYFHNYGYKRHFVPWAKTRYSGPGIGFWTMKPGNPDGYFIEPGLDKAFSGIDRPFEEMVKNL